MAESVSVELRATITDFTSKMGKARAELAKTKTEGSSQLALFGRAATDAFGMIGKQSGIAGSAMSALSASGGGLASAMGPVAIGVGAATAAIGLGATVIKSSVSAFSEYAAQVRAYEGATGASVQESERMVSVLRGLDVSVDDVTRGMGFLSKAIVDNPQKFAKLGVEIARNKDGTADLTGTLLNLGDAYKSSGSAALKNVAIRDLLGKGYTSLRPVLVQTRDALKDIGDEAARRGDLGISQKQINSPREMAIATRELKDSLGVLGRELGAEIIPDLTNMTRGAKDAVVWFDHLASKVGGVAGVARIGLRGMSVITGGVSDALIKMGKAGHEAADGEDDIAKKGREAADRERELESATSDLEGSIMSALSAQRSALDAQRSERKAVDSLVDARDRLNKLQRAGRVDADEVARAQDRAAQADRSAADAVERLTEAQQRLQEAERPAADLDREQAQLRAREAVEQVGLAQKKLIDLQRQGGASAEDLRGAHNDLEQAQIDQKRSAADLADVIRQGDQATPAVVSAKKDVEQATRAVKDAQDEQARSAAEVRKAQAGDPEFDAKLADARRNVADAEQAVSTAQSAVSQSAFAAAEAVAKEKTALEDAGPASEQLRANLDQIARDYPAAAAFIAQIESVLPGYSASPGGLRLYEEAQGGGGPGGGGQLAQSAGGGAQVRRLASGGWVDAPLGMGVPAIVHGGEYVESAAEASARRSGSSGTVTHVTHIYLDGRKIATAMEPHIRERLNKNARRNPGLARV